MEINKDRKKNLQKASDAWARMSDDQKQQAAVGMAPTMMAVDTILTALNNEEMSATDKAMAIKTAMLTLETSLVELEVLPGSTYAQNLAKGLGDLGRQGRDSFYNSASAIRELTINLYGRETTTREEANALSRLHNTFDPEYRLA